MIFMVFEAMSLQIWTTVITSLKSYETSIFIFALEFICCGSTAVSGELYLQVYYSTYYGYRHTCGITIQRSFGCNSRRMVTTKLDKKALVKLEYIDIDKKLIQRSTEYLITRSCHSSQFREGNYMSFRDGVFFMMGSSQS